VPAPLPSPPLVNPPASTPGLRTLGTGATESAAGNDARLRTPSNAQPIPAAGKIPIAGVSGQIDAGWIPNAYDIISPTTMDSAGIIGAIAVAAGANRTIYLRHGTWAIDAAVLTPSNVTLRVEAGALLVRSGVGSLTITGALEAPMTYIFQNFNNGVLDCYFYGNFVREVYPQWFGAGTSGDDTAAIKAALLSHHVVRLPPVTSVTPYQLSDIVIFCLSFFRLNPHCFPIRAGAIFSGL